MSRYLLISAVIVLCLITWLIPPFDQPADYHDWVDTRSLWGIPNAGDVLSNLAFLIVGLLGLSALLRQQCHCDLPGEKLAWTWVFIGVALTGLGSGYYHWSPNNFSLTWDRLPMALAFMSLLSALLIERIGTRVGLTCLPVLIIAGCGSVYYWYWSGLHGAADLRFYVLIQLGALLLIPMILWQFPPRYSRGSDYLIALGFYALAMLTERLDSELFTLTGNMISGHTLKHLFAALVVYWLLRMLQRRRLLTASAIHH